MPLKVSQQAPDFSLRDLEGKEHVLPGDLNLLIFYKVSCPTCQLTLPFVEKMYRAYGTAIGFFGIAQDDPQEVSSFVRRYGLSFVLRNGEVIRAEESFLKSALESLNEELAKLSQKEPLSLFEGVSVPLFKPG